MFFFFPVAPSRRTSSSIPAWFAPQALPSLCRGGRVRRYLLAALLGIVAISLAWYARSALGTRPCCAPVTYLVSRYLFATPSAPQALQGRPTAPCGCARPYLSGLWCGFSVYSLAVAGAVSRSPAVRPPVSHPLPGRLWTRLSPPMAGGRRLSPGLWGGGCPGVPLGTFRVPRQVGIQPRDHPGLHPRPSPRPPPRGHLAAGRGSRDPHPWCRALPCARARGRGRDLSISVTRVDPAPRNLCTGRDSNPGHPDLGTGLSPARPPAQLV